MSNNHSDLYVDINIHNLKSSIAFYKDKINKHLRKLLFLIIQNMIKQRRHEQKHIVEYYNKLKT